MANFLRPLVFFFSMMSFLIEFNSESALSAGGQVNDLHDRKFVHRERGKRNFRHKTNKFQHYCEHSDRDRIEISPGGKPQLILIKSFIASINLFANIDSWKFPTKSHCNIIDNFFLQTIYWSNFVLKKSYSQNVQTSMTNLIRSPNDEMKKNIGSF